MLDVPHLPYFTEDSLTHDWPPGWLPHGEDERVAEAIARGRPSLVRKLAAQAERRNRSNDE